ncbi:U2AF2 isoform 6, partial [Pan troglodytes]
DFDEFERQLNENKQASSPAPLRDDPGVRPLSPRGGPGASLLCLLWLPSSS